MIFGFLASDLDFCCKRDPQYVVVLSNKILCKILNKYPDIDQLNSPSLNYSPSAISFNSFLNLYIEWSLYDGICKSIKIAWQFLPQCGTEKHKPFYVDQSIDSLFNCKFFSWSGFYCKTSRLLLTVDINLRLFLFI